jgi:hypothetical protein
LKPSQKAESEVVLHPIAHKARNLEPKFSVILPIDSTITKKDRDGPDLECSWIVYGDPPSINFSFILDFSTYDLVREDDDEFMVGCECVLDGHPHGEIVNIEITCNQEIVLSDVSSGNKNSENLIDTVNTVNTISYLSPPT